MASVFLSYARGDDGRFVRRLYRDLRKAGFDVWFDMVSMPSRQLTFYQEIRDAIAAADRLVLVVGSHAVTSDYVNQEWRFACIDAQKCVSAVVRRDGQQPDGARIDGYDLIPEDLRAIHAEDFRDDKSYRSHLANLIRQLSEPAPRPGRLVGVPELPAHYIAPTARLRELRSLPLADLERPVVVTGAAARVGLQGMGGIGKTVLASALARTPDIRRVCLPESQTAR